MSEPTFEQKETILSVKIDTFEVNSLDDLAHLFFAIGRALGKPLKKINLEKETSW